MTREDIDRLRKVMARLDRAITRMDDPVQQTRRHALHLRYSDMLALRRAIAASMAYDLLK